MPSRGERSPRPAHTRRSKPIGPAVKRLFEAYERAELREIERQREIERRMWLREVNGEDRRELLDGNERLCVAGSLASMVKKRWKGNDGHRKECSGVKALRLNWAWSTSSSRFSLFASHSYGLWRAGAVTKNVKLSGVKKTRWHSKQHVVKLLFPEKQAERSF